MSHHLAVMVEPFYSAVLDGTKTIESRFSKVRSVPYSVIRAGDVVYMKNSGLITARFEVKWVLFFDLTETGLRQIRLKYGAQIGGDEAFWQAQREKHYITLIGITNVQRIPPQDIPKRDRRGWMVLPATKA